MSQDKLDLGEGIVGASSAIFMKRVQYIDKTHLIKLITDIHVILMFHKILLPLISMIPYPVGKLQMHLEDMIEITI
jgi:hypothetical protein